MESKNLSRGSGNYLTVKQLYNACCQHDYLLLRFDSGYQMGVNGRIAKIAQRMCPREWEQKTLIISYKPCSLIEYIEHKHRYM